MHKSSMRLLIFFILFFTFNIIHNNIIFVTSIQKCGTHLLTKCIELITKKKSITVRNLLLRKSPLKNNEFLHQHLSYSQKIEDTFRKNGTKLFFIYRDPRDQIISYAFWMHSIAKIYEVCNYTKPCPKDLMPIINYLIKRVEKHYSLFLPWLKSDIACSIKFEDLIGPKGKGNRKSQRKTIKKICNFLNIHSYNRINYCIKNLFGGTMTFRKGEIGSWKDYFTNEQKIQFKKAAGNLLINLGYEKDFNW